MSTAATTGGAAPHDRRPSRIGALALALGGVLLWLGARMDWLIVDVFDDKSGSSSIALPGSTWSTEATAVALLLLVAAVAGFALRKWGRRIVGAVAALAAIGASVGPMTLLTGEPDPARAHQLLTSGAASQQANNPVLISSWAEITGMDVSVGGPVIAMLGCAVALFGGVLLAAKPGTDGPRLNKYEKKSQRHAKLAEDLKSSPDSGRVMWDALDADIDPTEMNDGGRRG